MFALIQAMPVGSLRPYIERIPAAEYLRMSYYERWYTAFLTRLLEQGIVTHAEVERGHADPAAGRRHRRSPRRWRVNCSSKRPMRNRTSR